MASTNRYRLYTFTANLYLSPLQCGLQTAHVVSELADGAMAIVDDNGDMNLARTFRSWAESDKTVIICAALNHGGVMRAYAELERLGSALGLPHALFREDEESMNSMATACGVVVPAKYYEVKADKDQNGEVIAYEYIDDNWNMTRYPLTHPEGQFCHFLKSFRLA